MKIDEKTIVREVAALEKRGKVAPYYLMIGEDTDATQVKMVIDKLGYSITIIQDVETPRMFMLVDQAGFDYLSDNLKE